MLESSYLGVLQDDGSLQKKTTLRGSPLVSAESHDEMHKQVLQENIFYMIILDA